MVMNAKSVYDGLEFKFDNEVSMVISNHVVTIKQSDTEYSDIIVISHNDALQIANKILDNLGEQL